MKLLLMTVLVLVTATTCSGWLIDGSVEGSIGIRGGIVNVVTDAAKKLVDFVARTGNNLRGISANMLGKVFLDQFKVFQPDTDTDHGHSLGMVPHCPAFADVIFVMDASSSIGADDFQKGIQFNRRITEHFKIGPGNVCFGAVVFSDEAQEVFGLDDYNDHHAVAAGLRRTPYLGAGSKTWKALEIIKKHNLFGSRHAQKIVVLLTDGQSSSIGSTTTAASALKDGDVEIIVVGIGSGISFELMSVASGHGNDNSFSARRYSDLLVVEQRVAKRICEIPAENGFDPPEDKQDCPVGHEQVGSNCVDIDECSRESPCAQNCINAVGGFRCTCNPGYVVNAFDDKQCDKVQTCHAMADVIFVIDASGSMGIDNFKLELAFASNLVKQFTVGPNNVRFGGLVFGTQVQKLFDLKDLSTTNAIDQALKKAPYLEGGTNTHMAFNLLKDEFKMFEAAAGGRAFAEDVVILLTDGESSRPTDTIQAAARLKDGGVRIIAVGIGNEVSTEEIQEVASTPDDAFQVASFELLTYIEELIKERACYQELGTRK